MARPNTRANKSLLTKAGDACHTARLCAPACVSTRTESAVTRTLSPEPLAGVALLANPAATRSSAASLGSRPASPAAHK